jgi:hypothetical protein
MDTSRIPDDLDVARGCLHATMLSLPLWGLLAALWYLLTALGD